MRPPRGAGAGTGTGAALPPAPAPVVAMAPVVAAAVVMRAWQRSSIAADRNVVDGMAKTVTKLLEKGMFFFRFWDLHSVWGRLNQPCCKGD